MFYAYNKNGVFLFFILGVSFLQKMKLKFEIRMSFTSCIQIVWVCVCEFQRIRTIFKQAMAKNTL